MARIWLDSVNRENALASSVKASANGFQQTLLQAEQVASDGVQDALLKVFGGSLWWLVACGRFRYSCQPRFRGLPYSVTPKEHKFAGSELGFPRESGRIRVLLAGARLLKSGAADAQSRHSPPAKQSTGTA